MLFGGFTSIDAMAGNWVATNETWLFDTVNLNWTLVDTQGVAPGPRGLSSMILVGSFVYLIGGCGRAQVSAFDVSCASSLSDIWTFSVVGSNWTPLDAIKEAAGQASPASPALPSGMVLASPGLNSTSFLTYHLDSNQAVVVSLFNTAATLAWIAVDIVAASQPASSRVGASFTTYDDSYYLFGGLLRHL